MKLSRIQKSSAGCDLFHLVGQEISGRGMKKLCCFSMLVGLIGAATVLQAETDQNALVVTATNAATNNQLLVYSPGGTLIQTVTTQGQGGAGGNSGGIEAKGNLVAVVNFGSRSVAIFERGNNGLQMKQLVPTVSSPVSVAFGGNHLYILGTTSVESHRMHGPTVEPNLDGVVTLLHADGSSAQVGVVQNQLIVTEKSNVIETINLLSDGVVSGVPSLVRNIPTNVDTPFGLVTRGNNAYVTIAHADEISLVRDGEVLTTTPTSSFPGPVQHAPCWLTLVGSFMYSSNSPSMTVSRYVVYGQKIVPDMAVAASFNGSPTDIASGEGLVAVIDGNATVSHLSIFRVNDDGNLTLQSAATIAGAANGVAVVRGED